MRVHSARVCPNFLSGKLDRSSAKYGFLWPTDLVEGQHNVSFSRRCDSVVRDVDLRDQVTRLCLSRFSEIVVIAATAYAAAVHRAFADRSVRIRSPLVGLPQYGFHDRSDEKGDSSGNCALTSEIRDAAALF
jgi:hypothetical protein